MSEACADVRREEMLHAYEVGILPDEERRLFEIHLLECDACFERAAGFDDTVRLLRRDGEVRRVVREMAREPGPSAPEGLGSRLWRFFSSASRERLRLSRPLALVVLLLLAAWPAWRIWNGPPRTLQRLELYPVRGAAARVVDLSAADDVEIRFVLDGAGPERVCDVRIDMADGFRIFSREGFRGFNAEGLGIVRLPSAIFRPGVCTLRLEESGGRDAPPLEVYTFRVVP